MIQKVELITTNNSPLVNKPLWYDDDKWSFYHLGINGQQSDNYVTVSFKSIKQDWLKEAGKQYIFNCSINKSCYFVSSAVSNLVSFSIYINKLPNSIKPYSLNSINREIIVGFISYLAQESNAIKTRQLRLLRLSRFLDACCERGWMNYSGKLIYPQDYPQCPKTIPRFIPESVLKQLNEHLDKLDSHIRRIILVLQETGMRINELIKLNFDCIYQDKEGDYFLKYFQSKLNKDHVIPISFNLATEIKSQQKIVCEEWGTHSLLFPVPEYIKHFKPDTKIIKIKNREQQWARRTLSNYINQFAEHYQIKDEQGKIWRFEFHQFRHTVATKMINHDVPQHIIQRFLGHESPTMTARYAHIMDQTLKKAFAEFNNKIINISGEVITPKEVVMSLAEGTNPDEIDARWLKKNIMAQALPNGTCALPVVSNSCPHANACLTCVNFRTDHRYLNIHKQQLEKTKAIISQAKTNGWQRQIEMNKKIEANLEKIITALETSPNDTST